VPLLRGNGVTAHEPALPPRAFNYDDDDGGDKTIPAAALPDEIKDLRAQFAARRSNAATSPSPSVEPAGASISRDKVLTDRQADPVRAVDRPAPLRTSSGETLSVTNKGNPSDWDDDEGVKTAVARPNELPGMLELRASAMAARRPPPQPVNFNALDEEPAASSPDLPSVSSDSYPPASAVSGGDLPTVDQPMSQQSLEELEAARPPRTGLVVVLILLGVMALLGALVLLDILPLPKVGLLESVTPLARRLG
jgi:hypothetical protein